MGTGQWAVTTTFESVLTWNYAVEHQQLRELYEKAKREQWNVSVDVDWSPAVEPESELLLDRENPHVALLQDSEIWRKMTPQERSALRYETLAWNLSQFLHGEQLAIFVAGQLTAAVPWMDAKLYGSTQVVDEARHAEVFSRYLREKIGKEYPLTDSTYPIFNTILTESRWDFKYLGLQVVLEGLAMGLFSRLYQAAREPILRRVLKLVMQDESRHFAFGNLSLRRFYDDMPEKERREREDFAYEICACMRGRVFPVDAWQTIGLPVEACLAATREGARKSGAQKSAFNRVVPALKAVGLLSDRIRPHYADMGLLKYEDAPIELELD
jgi:P-aminobenzoate N-oxygenase AurF